MKNKSTPILLIALAEAALAIGIAGCDRTGATRENPDQMSSPTSIGSEATRPISSPAASSAASAAVATTKQVAIDNFSFSPQSLTVSLGTRVTWTNHDDVPHTATSASKPRIFSSNALDTDESFSFVFTQPGTYPYFCAVHPHMTGQIIVTQP